MPPSPTTGALKSLALRVVAESGLATLCRPLTRSAAVVFMLHRFADPERGVGGYEVRDIRRLLQYLRAERYALVDVGTLLASLRGDGPPIAHAVSFTIDDGYYEHASIAAPLFAEFDCPVTTFVVTGFLDRQVWFWWDQITYVFARSKLPCVSVDVAATSVRYPLTDVGSRAAAADAFTTRCKALPEDEKRAVIARLAARAEVSLPAEAPPPYAPMSWDDVRACERRGMSFAPHTVTHPILSRIGDAQARVEIESSWNRLRGEAAAPLPVFAFPNGKPDDFGERDVAILREVGLRGALTTTEGYATARLHGTAGGAFRVPRVPCPSSMPHAIQQVAGLERLKSLLRTGALDVH